MLRSSWTGPGRIGRGHARGPDGPRAMTRGDEPTDPLPGPSAGATSVSALRAVKEGLIQSEARGQGDQEVKLTLHNASEQRASRGAPAGPRGGGRCRSGLPEHGLGSPSSNPGSFGGFPPVARPRPRKASLDAGYPGGDEARNPLDAGQTVDVSIPAVCLNFGIRPPRTTTSSISRTWTTTRRNVRARKASSGASPRSAPARKSHRRWPGTSSMG